MKFAALPLLIAISSVPVLAVSTSTWTATSEEDFAKGEMSTVVASNLGELKLSRATHPLLADTPLLDIVYAICPGPDGISYLATGAHGSILRYQNGKTTTVFTAGDNTLVTSLAVDSKGQLLAGLSGAHARLVRIDPATQKVQELYKSDQVEFIWAVRPLADGAILLGTGPSGQLIEVSPAGQPRVLYQAKESNVLCIQPGDKDDIFIGTDPEGLVIRVNRKTGDWFVLYDADEPEIVALSRDAKGNLYVAASSDVEASGAEEPGPEKAIGRPEPGTELPLRREAPTPPEPPKLPDPTPGEPEPIPKQPVDPVPHMDILDKMDDAPQASAHPKPTSQPASKSQASTKSSPKPSPKPSGSNGSGDTSAVYRIDPSGSVSEVFRKPVTILSMVGMDDTLLLGTGPEGLVYQITPETQETLVLARLESHQVSAITQSNDGRILLGLSNPGGLYEMDAGYANKGSFTSDVMDASQVARFGKLQLQGTLAPETSVTVATRSGNVGDPEIGGWSKWSPEIPAAEFVQIPSPAARFFQYRLTLGTRNPKSTPTIEEIKVNYLIPNLPPKISSLKVDPETTEPDPTGKTTSPALYHITWDASDPNDDRLSYTLWYRMGYRGDWILLKDKLKDTNFDWNTRQLADGRYQVKLTASDVLANPVGEGLTTTRYSDALIIDNTGPVIGDAKTVVSSGQVQVTVRVTDRTSTVAGCDYAIDSSDDWQAAPSSDMLYDSPDETVKFAVSGLSPGPHQLTLRARDSHGNTSYETLIVTIDQERKK